MRPMNTAPRLLLTLLLALSALLVSAQESDPADPAFFSHQVAPILQKNCFACHGPLRQRGGLRLDSRPAMLVGGDSGAAMVPGSAADSLLFQAVLRKDGLEMPPPRSLADDEIATLQNWLDAGAVWSFDTDEALEPATVAARDVPKVEDWLIDDFATDDPVSFNHHIRPLLSKHCFQCHGPDEAARQAGLRLDTREGALAELPSGRQAIRPGDLDASQLFQRIAASAPEDRMPPAEGRNMPSAETTSKPSDASSCRAHSGRTTGPFYRRRNQPSRRSQIPTGHATALIASCSPVSSAKA